jgi:hypothetical protein
MCERLFPALSVAAKVKRLHYVMFGPQHNVALILSLSSHIILCNQDPCSRVAAEGVLCLVNLAEASNQTTISRHIDSILSLVGELVRQPPSLEVQKFAITAIGAL